MNFIICTVRLLEIPKIKLYQTIIPFAKCRVEIPQARNRQIKSIVEAEIWGKLVYDLKNYYRVNDILIIEGYFSNDYFCKNLNSNKTCIKLNILRFYPFFIENDLTE